MKKQIKKWTASICIAAMLVSFPMAARAAYSFADVDGDGHVYAADARLVLRVAEGLIPAIPEMIEFGDMDGDGVLSANDTMSILRLAVRNGAGQASEEPTTQDATREPPTQEATSEQATQETADPKAPEGAQLVGYTAKGYEIYEKDGITYIDGILIANKTYSLPSDYDPGALLDECQQAFDSMVYDAAYHDGLQLYEQSGFRSYATQERIYNNYVAADGQAEADTYSARPGHSEHQSGLAIDVNSLSSSFAETAEGIWLAENCHKYGFILRYPAGKTDITGYIYEPWHIRYVGVEIATAIYESGLCLEEYYGITSQYAS